ncbi:cystathionine beta-lyase [Amorphus orientalis]|uniref:Cystathionine beta-lyase n=1 Tax=Amorphus orientalis TaxID=649198 RepID=A0AAE3VQI6_9HYPH|nr:cystathionine beta-lyase [Amorphus orientalis]MDQ0316340.1 cystathionine beta-lyase [Amorphus orientalis]
MTNEKPFGRAGLATRLAHAGPAPSEYHGFVNPPVVHASTVIYDSLNTAKNRTSRYMYGRTGTPTTEALEDTVTDLEGAAGTVLTGSGLEAISIALMSCTQAGSHLLVADNVYGPTRRFCDKVLTRFGVEVEYFDPAVGAEIDRLFRDTTSALFLEAPGSLTFEMQDIPAMAGAARSRGITVAMDNTWATPVYFRPLDHGVDLSIQAATKYFAGHSDLLLGTVAASEAALPSLRETRNNFGVNVGPDDVFNTLRGMRTLPLRLARHFESGVTIARWLETRPEVARVRHPALESDPGHEIWKRDFSGACGLFAIELQPCTDAQLAAFIEGLAYFGIGASWGGFESLVLCPDPSSIRTATNWDAAGPLVRLHVGLEDPEDLIADLQAGLARLVG